MKWIIYLLLIFNIGFAAWHFRGIDMREDGSTDVLNVNNENELILLSEFRQKQKSESEIEGAKLCYSFGPFIEKTDADKARETLKESGVDAQQIKLRDTSRTGYWVILPASESRQAANKNIARLKELKIKDYFLVATGTHENAISLGVYSQKNLARRRVDEIIRLGFVPRMESVALPRKVFWLNWYKDSSGQPEDTVIENLKKSGESLTKVERSCK